MAHAWMIGDLDVLRYVIKHELKDHGVKITKLKGTMRTNSSAPDVTQVQDINAFIPLFGVPLSHIPSCKDLQSGLEIPRFIQDCVQFLSKHLNEEGLFRKSGSHVRQKELQNKLSHGEPISNDTQVADVAGVFKRFFRELPEPIIPVRVQSSLLKCVSMEDEILQEWTSLLLLCLLPSRELQLLRYVTLFLAKVASNSENNKMDTKNLARVLMPTILGGDGGGSKTTQIERQIKLQTLVIEIMINNAKDIGLVPDYILDRMVKTKSRSTDSLDNIVSDDDLDRASDDNLDQNMRLRRKKRRSGTFQGFVNGLGQVSQKVGELLKPSGSLDNLNKTPEEMNSGGTPRNLRSSKRKASDDIGSLFSATKRKAMLRQMTVDPQYSKRGVYLHKSNPSSPMTPLQSTKPALGEIDAVASDGKTLFHFNTPSIKFADDSFSGFTSSPSSSATADSLPPGATPRRNKLKKLNPLNSRRFKRLSLGTIGGSSKTPTPLKPHQRQNNKCSINWERSYENVGHRLANQPFPEGLDSLRLIPRHPECRETFRHTSTGQTNENVTTTMYTPPQYLMKNRVRRQPSRRVKERGAATAADESKETFATSDDNSFDAVRHEGEGWTHGEKMGPCQSTDWSLSSEHGNAEGASSFDIDDPSCLTLSDTNEVEDMAHLDHEDKDREGRTHDDRAAPEPVILGKKTLTMCNDEIGSIQSYSVGKDSGQQRSSSHPLQYSESQKSVSSILSSVTVQSTKSYFSVEEEQEEAGEVSSPQVNSNTDIPYEDHSSCTEEERDNMEVVHSDEAKSEPVSSSGSKISGSLCSLDSTVSKNKTADWILKKTISLDSGRGESTEDLLPIQDDTDFDLTPRQLPSSLGDFDCKKYSHVEQQSLETSSCKDYAENLSPEPILHTESNFPKVNPSKLKPLKVNYNDSAMKKFHIMQKRLNADNGEKEYKSVKQKIRMFNSLSHDDVHNFGEVRRVRHHSGSTLPTSFYERKTTLMFTRKEEAPSPDVESVSLSPLVKSVSYDSGLKELSNQASELTKQVSDLSKQAIEKDEGTPPSQQLGSPDCFESVMNSAKQACDVTKQASVEDPVTPPSQRLGSQDSYEAVMNSAKKALSNFQRFAETCTPMSQRKPLAVRNTKGDYPIMQSLDDHQPSSPRINAVKSPSIKKQLKRLDSENSPSWQRGSPKGHQRPDNYMHLLKSPKRHHGSPVNPLVLNENKVGRRRSNARRVRREWQV